MKNLNSNIIPTQHVGSRMDAVETRKLGNLTSARDLFAQASKRMLSINNWGNFSPGTAFKLFDSAGAHVDREAKTGDYIRIDIPGPGPKSGEGFDWVFVEEIQRHHDGNVEFTGMRLRPSINPLGSGKDVAHFLNPEATSTFIIRRERITVWAEEHGRNETVNTQTDHPTDKLRNLVVGLAAKLGLSYPQWKTLINGLLDGKV